MHVSLVYVSLGVNPLSKPLTVLYVVAINNTFVLLKINKLLKRMKTVESKALFGDGV